MILTVQNYSQHNWKCWLITKISRWIQLIYRHTQGHWILIALIQDCDCLAPTFIRNAPKVLTAGPTANWISQSCNICTIFRVCEKHNALFPEVTSETKNTQTQTCDNQGNSVAQQKNIVTFCYYSVNSTHQTYKHCISHHHR